MPSTKGVRPGLVNMSHGNQQLPGGSYDGPRGHIGIAGEWICARRRRIDMAVYDHFYSPLLFLSSGGRRPCEAAAGRGPAPPLATVIANLAHS